MKSLINSFAFLFLFIISSSWASTPPIPADQAFRLNVSVENPETLQAQWKITPGYFLYKDRFSYKVVSPEGTELGPIALPEGIEKHDEILGQYQVYQSNLTLKMPLKNVKSNELMIKICYQGCSADGYCYPPQTKEIALNLDAPPSELFSGKTVNGHPPGQSLSEQDKLTELLASQSFWLSILSFFGFGLLLSFTPCVLPMVPILSGIIIGHGKTITLGKAFRLSLTYVIAMAATYAVAGVLAGFAGQTLQAALQQTWLLIGFSGIFVLLSLSLFGFYELRLPAAITEKISSLSNKQHSGHYLSVAIMGILATLIVSPCVSPPLIGALAYIGQTGDAILGGSALFAMGLGMGVPLLIIGTSGGKLLPKAGPWMKIVEATFGVILLAVAVWMLSRILPGQLVMFFWAGLLIIPAVYMGILNPMKQTGWANFWRGLGLVFAIYGVILMIGAAMGNDNPLEPLEQKTNPFINYPASKYSAENPEATFITIKTNDDFDRQLNQATLKNKITMLDFYADWCISCKEMDRHTFTDPNVKAKLQKMVLLRADVTNNDIEDRALEERLKVIAPPTILFFDKDGSEIVSQRIVGEKNAEQFLQHLERVLGD